MLSTKFISLCIAAVLIFLSLAAGKSERVVFAIGRSERWQQPVPSSLVVNPDSNFDVKHYDIHIRIDVANRSISGTVTLKALAVVSDLKTIRLDLADEMNVESVTSDGQKLTFDHSNRRLTINLARTYRKGSPFEVTTNYSGQPSTPTDRSPGFLFSSRRSVPVVGSFGLPLNAPDWLSCKDGPGDKADSADIAITLPQELVAVSNGNLVNETNNSNGTKTSSWAIRYPIYPDVISVMATNYVTFTLPYKSLAGGSMDIKFYVYPEDLEKAKVDFSMVPDMMSYYASIFGEYPFLKEKYGIAEFERGWKEHQTIPSYTYMRLTGDHKNDFIVGHELAHQWFGNSLSLKNRSHIWLNEGFSDYAYWLWVERSQGRTAYMSVMKEASQSEFSGPIYIIEPKMSERSKLTSLSLFARSAVVLHMLRHVMGDASFFQAMKKYVKTFTYKNVDTEDYQRICEQVYGRQLGWFFKEWVYGAGQPEYQYKWTVAQAGNKQMLKLLVNQVQTGSLFQMPLDVEVTTPAGKQTFVVWNKLKTESFDLPVTGSVSQVEIDPQHWVLKKLKTW